MKLYNDDPYPPCEAYVDYKDKERRRGKFLVVQECCFYKRCQEQKLACQAFSYFCARGKVGSGNRIPTRKIFDEIQRRST